MNKLRIGVIGDYDADHPLHPKTTDAVRHSLDGGTVDLKIEWLATDVEHDLSCFHGLWCAPGSPYRSLDGALNMICWARRNRCPFLGTCGGAQHAILEFGRNVMNLQDAQHAEYDPYASVLFVNRLSCSLVGKIMPLDLKVGSLAASIYGTIRSEERYYCNFGLNPEYQSALEAAGLVISGWDTQGARIFELPDHPFFVATLFVPQDRSTPQQPHPIIRSFASVAQRVSRQREGQISPC